MNKSPLILQIAVDTPLRFALDYLAPEEWDVSQLQLGMRVQVPFRNKETIGILCGMAKRTNTPVNKLKYALTIVDNEAVLPENMMALINWASDYYHYPIGEVYSAALPKLIRQGRKTQLPEDAVTKLAAHDNEPEKKLKLNSLQKKVLTTIKNHLNQFKPFLLDGVTGSGKTEVYLQAIAAVLKQGQQALVLVPEISLTPQTVARFQQRFALPIAVLHSQLTERQRLDAWLAAREGLAPLVIGTRSAIFTPMPKLGMIIIDEEHDASLKQQDGFRYSARDLAVVRAQRESIPIILGSATPSLESQYNMQSARYERLSLPARAGKANLPTFKLIDLRNQRLINGLSQPLITHIRSHLDNDGQILLFLNRRGFAPSLVCHFCGWIAACQRCDAHMTLHQATRSLHCHHCDSARVIDTECPQCHNQQLQPLGLGTERIEHAIEKHFSDVLITRVDKDSTRKKGAMQTMLDDIHSGKSRILIGTQMLAKGHHFPNVTLVVIINADTGFFSADLRASERMGQLVMQVAGRAGRADKPGEVIIQTYHPDHQLLTHLIQHDYQAFSAALLDERKKATCPPYTYHVLIRAEAIKQGDALHFLKLVHEILIKLNHKGVWLLGPIPSPMERKAGRYRAQLLLQANKRQQLHQLLNKAIPKIEKLKSVRKIRWSLDVDPMDMF